MDQPALKFVDQPYDKETVEKVLSDFREKGYAVLPGVFERSTVDDFVSQLKDIMYHDGLRIRLPHDSPHMIWPARAPRIRQVLPWTLSHSVATPLPCLFHSNWLIHPEGIRGLEVEWHKDRDPEGMPGKEYHYPKDVFVGIYFEDMEEKFGPSKVVPGSHRDITLNPYAGPHAGAVADQILCRKEDVYLLDQRTWHRGSTRTAPGARMLVIYGFYPVPFHYSFPFTMPRAQKAAWLSATSREDIAFFGGIFAPPDKLKKGPS